MQNRKRKGKRVASCIFDESNNVFYQVQIFKDTHVEVFERYHLDFMKKQLTRFKTHRYKRKLRSRRKNYIDDANLIFLRFLTVRLFVLRGNPRWEPIQNSADQR